MRRALLLLCLSFAASPGGAAEVAVPPPGERELCPVCGMFVAKYPEWVATVRYRDGHAHHFDGPKDLFKYLFDLPRYAPGHNAEEIAAIAVTDYYAVKAIDAREAWFVIGSDVTGPMGRELVALERRDEAEEFAKDHGGKRILTFAEVTPAMVAALDQEP